MPPIGMVGWGTEPGVAGVSEQAQEQSEEPQPGRVWTRGCPVGSAFSRGAGRGRIPGFGSWGSPRHGCPVPLVAWTRGRLAWA